MFGKVTKFLYQTIRSLRGLVSNNSSESSLHNRSNSSSRQKSSINLSTSNLKLNELILSDQSFESTESNQSIELIESIDEMAMRTKYNKLTGKFEIRLENSVKLTKDNRMMVKNTETNDTIDVDDDIQEVFTNLIAKNQQKTETKKKMKQLKLFANVTNRIQNTDSLKPIKEVSIEKDSKPPKFLSINTKSSINSPPKSSKIIPIVKPQSKQQSELVQLDVKSPEKISQTKILQSIQPSSVELDTEPDVELDTELDTEPDVELDAELDTEQDVGLDFDLKDKKKIQTATLQSIQNRELSKDDLKAVFKNLKPENYRIQQVIKEEDLVFFDLETGGMGSKQDILQIGAVNHENKQFNIYCTPNQPIPGMSSRIHHITYKDNQMFYRKNQVQHHSIVESLLRFCDYLEQTKSNQIVLVAHNANFDRRFLIEKAFLYNLQGKLNKIIGFIDTLPLFRQLIPGKPSYKQDGLVLSFFPHTKTDFHNALTDVIYLKKLFQRVATNKMRNEYKYINGFTQSLEYGFMKKEQQIIEETSKKRPAKKETENQPIKKRKATSGLFIDGEPVKRTRKTRSSKTNQSNEIRRSPRRSNRNKK